MQDSRSQHANRRAAWQILRAKLAEMRREAREQENYGQSRCTDHRSGVTVHNLGDVLDGGDGLETVMASVRAWLDDRQAEAMLAEELAKPGEDIVNKE